MPRTNKQRDRDRFCERFLTARASAQSLCQQVGMADLANQLIPVLSDLQEAHGRLVAREANRVLIQIVKGIRAKLVTSEQAQELFLLDGAALDALLNYLNAPPKQDLATGAERLHLHKQVLERVRKMSAEEGFRSLVASGIYTPEGKLALEYGGGDQ